MFLSAAGTSAGAARSALPSRRWIGLQRGIRIVSVPIVWEKLQRASWGLNLIEQAAGKATERGNDADEWSIFRR